MSRLLRVLPLLLASALAVVCLPLQGTPDYLLFLHWVDKLDAAGLENGYRLTAAHYPPLGFVALSGVTPLADALGIAPHLALKLILLAALALSTAIVWAWTADAAIAGLMALGLLLNGPALGYLDVLFLPTLLCSLWALQRERWALASLCFALTCMIKWQPLALAPLLLVAVLAPAARGQRLRRWAAVVLPALAVVGLTLLIFGTVLLGRLRLAMSDSFLSAQAFNANWIATYALRALHPDWYGGLQGGMCTSIATRDPAVVFLPKLLFAGVYLALCVAAWRHAKTFPDILRYALLAYLGYFLFNSGVHENHLFLAQVLAVLLYAFDRRRLGTALFWMLAGNLNLLLYYGIRGEYIPEVRLVGGFDIGLPLAILNVAAFVALVAISRRDASNGRLQPSGPALR